MITRSMEANQKNTKIVLGIAALVVALVVATIVLMQR